MAILSEEEQVKLAKLRSLVERPYNETGIDFTPRKNIYESTDSRNEGAVLADCRRVLEPYGVRILGVRDVPCDTKMRRIEVDGILWDMARITHGHYELPETVYHRLMALYTARIRFLHFIWCEEVYPNPLGVPEGAFKSDADKRPLRFLPVPDPVTANKQSPQPDSLLRKLLRGSVITGASIIEGISYMVTVDPQLIGVIPTEEYRGVWCLLGKWFHSFD